MEGRTRKFSIMQFSTLELMLLPKFPIVSFPIRHSRLTVHNFGAIVNAPAWHILALLIPMLL